MAVLPTFWIWTVIFIQKVNKQMVNIEKVTSKFDVSELKGMIEEHVAQPIPRREKKSWIISKNTCRSLRRSFRVITREC